MAINLELPAAEWYSREQPEELECLHQEMQEDVHLMALDTETTGLDIIRDYPLFWSLSWGSRRICMPADTLPYFKDVLEDPRKTWVLANAKYDKHMLANIGITMQGALYDVQVMHALLYDDLLHNLKYINEHINGWHWRGFSDTFQYNKKGKLDLNAALEDVQKGKGAFKTPQDALMWCAKNDPQALTEYASNDAYGTMQSYLALDKEARETNIYSKYPDIYATMADYFYKIEAPFTSLLWDSERHGVKVDAEYLHRLEAPVGKQLEQLAREVNKAVGYEINPNSAHDLRRFFFEECKIKSRKLTKGGKSGIQLASVDASVLEELACDNPVAKLVLEYRELAKFLSTYVLGLAKHMDKNGRIHTTFHQDVARTGRLSSSDPNLQNLPNPENDKFHIRRAFIPEEPYTLIVGDYDTLEMRLLACASEEPTMVEMIRAGRDIHMGNATLVFGARDGFTYDDILAAKKMQKKVQNGELPPEALTGRMHQLLRRRIEIKKVGFGLNYGMKAKKLALDLGVTKEEAEELVEAYLSTYPAVSGFFDEAVAEARSLGYAWTILGRRRFLKNIQSNNNLDRWGDERKACNSPIQGTAADVVKMGMLRIQQAGVFQRFGCRLTLQIHDELVLECPPDVAAEARACIKELMEHPLPTDLAVPLTVSMGGGPNWSDAH